MEQWKDVPGYEGYQITMSGIVRSNKLRKTIMKTRLNKDGYVCLELQKDKKRCYTTLHRLLALTFILNPENKEDVNHKDGNKQNNSLDNLEWCSKSENSIHRHQVLKKLPPGIPVQLFKGDQILQFQSKMEAIRYLECPYSNFHYAVNNELEINGWKIKI